MCYNISLKYVIAHRNDRQKWGVPMKLRLYDESLEEKMSEFDIWVTPSLGEIRDMPQFKVNLEGMKRGFDYMAQVTNNYESLE